ncbi:hypothetical protein [Chryseobacterium sp. MMS23-Vi53]|uniref:hypothetical protein n=1 Tax=Chryseobacterium sp. MMS23-Vi53 TaxID=3386644 RepID=UPI0039E8243D
MRLLLVAITFISISASAQEKEKKKLIPRSDTTKLFKLDSKKIQPPQRSDQQKSLYKMPNATPRDTAIYSRIRSKKRDTTDYKMLNSTPPEKSKNTEKTTK